MPSKWLRILHIAYSILSFLQSNVSLWKEHDSTWWQKALFNLSLSDELWANYLTSLNINFFTGKMEIRLSSNLTELLQEEKLTYFLLFSNFKNAIFIQLFSKGMNETDKTRGCNIPGKTF